MQSNGASVGLAAGSNCWVVGGKHTASGSPLLASDPHLDNAMPSDWLLMKIHYPSPSGAVHIGAATMPGLPIFLGQTDYVSFGVTVNYADTQDLYVETLSADGQSYLLDGEWRLLSSRAEVLKVKGDSDQVLLVKGTHRGPILSTLLVHGGFYNLTGKNLSLAWSAFHANISSVASMMTVGEITSWEAWLAFLDEITPNAPCFDLLFATRDHHIGYQLIGRYPKRAKGHTGAFPAAGNTSAWDWIGFLSPSESLRILDPERGFIVSANSKTTGNAYLGGWSDSLPFTARATRATQLLQERVGLKKVTLEDMRAIQQDTVDQFCLWSLPRLLAHTPPELSAALGGFDCDMRADSWQAAVYEVFTRALLLAIVPQKPLRWMEQPGSLSYLHQYIERGADLRANSERAWKQAKAELQAWFGTEERGKWLWGKIHREVNKHRPLGEHWLLGRLVNLEADGWGNYNTINVGRMTEETSGNYNMYHRANLRMLLSFGEESRWVLDGGTSGSVFSSSLIDTALYDNQWASHHLREYFAMNRRPLAKVA